MAGQVSGDLLNAHNASAVRFPRMPAEWEPHEATWLAWPHEKSDWPGKFAPIPWLYGEIVRQLARVERVRIVVQDAEAEQSARRILKKCHANLDAVELFQRPTDRSWIRDYGPIFVRRRAGGIAASHWRFNGWAKYENFYCDARVPEFIANQLGLRSFEPGLVLEGGSIDVNGAGKLLTTEECLLSTEQARNPGVSRRDLERAFRRYLGVTEVIWLGRGIRGDDTHGHVDDIARFTSTNTVVAAYEPERSDPNHLPLAENLDRLRACQDLKIERLPMPGPVEFSGQILPASYANFYIANRLVLVPQFSDPNDLPALRTLARLFPDREIIPIPCRDLVLGLGALHCMTQPQPAA
jgi:agmatine deiminase